MYLMGHRIVSFLTKCLPRHPGLGRAPHVRQQSKQELDNLQKCLESVALLIDEHVCNQFVDDGDVFLDSMLAAEMDEEDDEEEKTSATRSTTFSTPKKAKQDIEAGTNWLLDFPEGELEPTKANTSKCVSFAEQKQDERKSAESPTTDTIGTCGTESLEPTDTSYTNCDSPNSSKENEETLHRADSEATDDDDGSIIRDCDDDDNFDIDKLSKDGLEDDLDLVMRRPMSMMRGVRLDFLRTIACEPVLYETDSEAADSWANTVEDVIAATNSRPCLPSSSGVTPTCDPARIAFRELMNKLPHESILQRNNQPKLLLASSSSSSTSSTSNPLDRSPSSSPTLTDILGELNTGKTSGVEYTDFDDILDNEIKEYLDSSKTDEDPTQFVEKCHEKLNTKSKGSSKIHRQQKRDDRSQISSYVSSSSSSSSSSATVGSASSSSCLKSLTNKTGSKTSAFSSFSRPKHQPPRERQSITSAVIFDLDDWISFDNSTGNSYFADSPF